MVLKRQKTVYILTLLVILTSIYTFPNTYGKYKQSIKENDSAYSAKFDIDIISLEQFNLNSYNEYYFTMPGDEISLNFRIVNNSEVSAICRPYINNGVAYRIITKDGAKSEFIVGIGEIVEFQLIIMSGGLSAIITEASLFVDIQQL